VNPHDPEAEVTKMKDGTTHLAYKAEQAVDLDTGVIGRSPRMGARRAIANRCGKTLRRQDTRWPNRSTHPPRKGSYRVHEQGLCEVVTDKGYHSGAGLAQYERECSDLRFSSPTTTAQLGRQSGATTAVYANRRRVEGERGKSLLRRRGELLERPVRASI